MIRKILSILRWFVISVLLQVLLIPLSYIIYPISYIFRKNIRRIRYSNNKILPTLIIPLWIFLDDTCYIRNGHDYGDEWWLNASNINVDNKLKEFLVSYRWSVIRNPAWNHHSLFNMDDSNIEVISIKGGLKKNGSKVEISEFATLKYVDDNGNYSDNKGKYLSIRFSILGEIFVWYKLNNKIYWRYSFAKNIFAKTWVEIHLGTGYRYTLRFKIKTNQIVYENI